MSNVPRNWTQPALGVTLIDAMSTLWVLGLRDEFQEAADHVAASFDPLDIAGGRFVDVFETTIRVLGGLVSAYSLSGDERLLNAAETFADALPALSASPSGIPFRGIASLRDGVVTPSTGATCGTAPAGTLLLEFRAVARLANRPDLEELALRSWRALGKATGRVKGLTPSKLKMTSSGCAAQFVFGNQSKLTVGSGVDSYYEYLLKGLAPGGRRRQTAENVERCCGAQSTPTSCRCAVRPRSWPTSRRTRRSGNRATHLACFWPGLRALEAIADPQVASSVLPLAEKLLDACVAAYDATPTNLAPEAWHVNDDGSVKLGANLRHLLRPETIESVFWMYPVWPRARSKSGSTPRRASGPLSGGTLQ